MEPMKSLADDWNNFIITSCLWAAKDLIPDNVLEMWSHFVTAYKSLLQSRELTEELEREATNELKKFAKAVEEVCFLFFIHCHYGTVVRI